MTDTSVLEKEDIQITETPLWNVIFHNDNVTAMEFVVMVLVEIFGHNLKDAIRITTQVHENESGVAGTYNYEMADQKMYETLLAAKQYGYPLKVTIREE